MKEEIQVNLFGEEVENLVEIENEIKSLRKQIEYYNKKYYEEEEPELSDYAYDKLTYKLKKLEERYPQFVVASSPTQKIGGKGRNIFEKVEHEVQMQSLQDVFSFEDVEEFVDKVIEEFGQNTKFMVETKIDGLSVSLEYKEGMLVRGSTRGDGFIGEDVTQNIKMIKDIPLKLPSKDTMEIRGEVYLPRKEFDAINDELVEKGKPMLANPRNAAAGTLRQLDAELVKARNLSIFVFTVLKGLEFESDSKRLAYLNSIGIKTIEFVKVCNNKEEVIAAIQEIGKMREKLPYDIDGAVINVDNLNYRKEMGSTVKVPKWSVAYKYPPERKETKVIDIALQVGRTGQVTPLAILEPVKLAGSVISKTTLHNFDYIEEKDVRVGDIAIIEKAGDVIPEVVDVVKEKRKGNEVKYTRPTVCPICGEKLESEEDIVALRCTNSECPALIYKSITHFASRDCMDISGLGEAIIEQLIDAGLLKDIADIYYLKYNDIVTLERFKEKSAANLINAIETSKSNSLDKLLFGLGIRHIGKKAAKVLSQNYENIVDIMKATVEEINSFNDFGRIMAESVVDFFQKEETKHIIERLEVAGVNLKGSIATKKSHILEDKTIVVTGSFTEYTREEVAEMIEEHSGKFSSSVTKKTSFVVAGEEAGSKLRKANELGIPIITIEEFLKMIEE
ncbi:MAG: NAD-dependent DNA ligase LigA [Clostridia bacterium]|nr:NAD-dependent DNA ligase LigA [Clostridia bacterium]